MLSLLEYKRHYHFFCRHCYAVQKYPFITNYILLKTDLNMYSIYTYGNPVIAISKTYCHCCTAVCSAPSPFTLNFFCVECRLTFLLKTNCYYHPGWLSVEIVSSNWIASRVVTGFASTRVMSQTDRKILRENFVLVLDKFGLRGLGWEIMNNYFHRCPHAYQTFEKDMYEDGSRPTGAISDR